MITAVSPGAGDVPNVVDKRCAEFTYPQLIGTLQTALDDRYDRQRWTAVAGNNPNVLLRA